MSFRETQGQVVKRERQKRKKVDVELEKISLTGRQILLGQRNGKKHATRKGEIRDTRKELVQSNCNREKRFIFSLFRTFSPARYSPLTFNLML